MNDSATETKRKKKEKKEKKEKRGRPQNALLALASSMGDGAAVSTNVVDLRCLDTASPQVSYKHNIRTVNEEVPPTQILSFLYLGSVRDAQNPDFLAKHNIRYIVNVSQEEYWSVDKRVQIVTYKVDDTATADIASLFAPTRSLINSVRERYYRSEAAGKASRPAVLVHCQKGRSRSVTIVLAYLVYMNGWSVAEAMKYVATRRPCAEPNIGFMEELRKLQESLGVEERTKRYSELCWFMRNLDVQTSEAQLREMFEQRVGMVRDVVMLTAPGSGSVSAQTDLKVVQDGRGDAGDREAATVASRVIPDKVHSSGSATKLVSFSMDGKEEDDEGGAAAVFTAPTGGEEEATAAAAATHEAAHAKSSLSASSSTAVATTVTATTTTGSNGNKRVALCFVFLTCREDILRGIKHGQLRDILKHLRPAPGKQIKYATGPKLRKLMTEHQSMSSSFAQDMAPFSGQVPREATSAADDSHACNDAASSTNKL